MKISFTARALLDLEQIAEYLDPLSHKGMRNVGSAIRSSIANLAHFPSMGRLQTVPNVRKINVRRYPYRVYYTLDDDAGEVVILAIQHASREATFTDF